MHLALETVGARGVVWRNTLISDPAGGHAIACCTHIPRPTPSTPPFPSPPSAGAGLARARRHTAIFQPLPRLVGRWCSDLGLGRGRWDGAIIISNHPRRPSAFNWKLHRAYAPDAPPRLPPEIKSPVVTTLAGIAPPKHIKSVKEKTCIIQ